MKRKECEDGLMVLSDLPLALSISSRWSTATPDRTVEDVKKGPAGD